MFLIENLHKNFNLPGQADVRAVDGISLRVETGKLITLLGPSGCGKTTTLRCLAGLERPQSGRIVIDNKVVFDSESGIFIPPSERGLGMVFQSYAIWPHMTVGENVAFPLRVSRTRKFSSAEIASRVKSTLELVRLGGYENRAATQLSGGQQQRLAFARGLVCDPQLLLLDEPLSNLDAKLREQMRVELKRLQRRLGVTTVYVTHDQSEALALSDEIAVFSTGRIVQQGTPQDIYRRPQSRYVADFVGSANFIDGKIDETDGEFVRIVTPHGVFRCIFSGTAKRGEAATVSARPEDLAVGSDVEAGAPNTLSGKVIHRLFLGEVIDYVVDIGGRDIRVRAAPVHDYAVGSAIRLAVPPKKCVGLTV
jgi:iron(III) transport system ATP-binding protein